MSRHAQRLIFGLYLVLAVVATVQRGVLTDRHATFPIFRQSFVHLSAGADLYATYPAEQGTEDRDRFKYSPTAALFFAPFALLPLLAGLALWTVLNVVALHAAVRALFPARDAPWALLIVFPALIAAVQSTSSNALMAALMIATFLALERRNAVGAASAMAAGTLMKLYPAAAAAFVLAHPRRWRAMAVCAGVFAAFVLAPLLVVSPAELAQQYRSWFAILAADGRDLTFARSIMVVVRGATGAEISNQAFQMVAGAILVAPVLVRPAALRDAGFRRAILASILIFVVIFNHQAENASYVIAAVGLAIWFLASPRTPARIALLVLCLAGLEAVPFALVWLWIQVDLLDDRLFATMRGRVTAWWPAWEAARGAARAPALRRLGVVAGAAGVALLSLSPRVRPVVPLKPATLPDASAARGTVGVTAQAEGEHPAGGRPARRRVRGTGETAVPALMREVAFSSWLPGAIDVSLAGRRPEGVAAPGLVRTPDADRAEGTGTRTGAVLNTGASATVDAGESCAVDTLGAAVPEAWKATRVGAVRVESGSIDLPNARLASVARRLHVTTRPDVVRRELGFRTGDAVDPRRILESVRRLRESALFSDVILEGRRCAGAGTTDLSLRTNDAWTTRGSIRLGGRAPVQA
ncbi:MAG: glycosyltransferase family 87 protein, partial [Gemmatimonadota bacterium]|nr:glycosyltransferase family 87 protein [Gemmatimonadota bacterium]